MENRELRPIGIFAAGSTPEHVVDVVAAHIAGCMNLATEVAPAAQRPEHAYDPRRLQYDAGRILHHMETLDLGAYRKAVMVVDVDLFVPIFTHVFGEARQAGRCALVSVFRLSKQPDGGTPPVSLVLERAAKVALHELGHLFNLFHCDDDRCLMHFSGGLEDLDRTPVFFCRYCALALREARSGDRI